MSLGSFLNQGLELDDLQRSFQSNHSMKFSRPSVIEKKSLSLIEIIEISL